jgi:hypothetical protein
METMKQRVLIVAPELRIKLTDVSKNVLIAISEVVDETDYEVTINDETYVINSGVDATSESLTNALALALGADENVIVSIPSTGLVRLVADQSIGIDFSISVYDRLVLTVVNEAYDANAIFTQLYEDVQFQVTELNFKDEQIRAQTYLLAHLLTLANTDPFGGSGMATELSQETVGDVTFKVSTGTGNKNESNFYEKTIYGKVFYEIQQRRWFRFV